MDETPAKQKLLPPIQATADMDTGCARLWFGDDSIAPTGFYQVVGGICWPLLIQDVFKGCAILAARHVPTGIVYVFDQHEFSSIEHIFGTDGNIEVQGLAPWFNRQWTTFYASRYYWFQHDEYERTFRSRIHRCNLIQPKPALIPTHWHDDQHARLIISDMLEQRRLKLKQGPVLQELAQQQADPKMGPFPAIHAIACLLTGISARRQPSLAKTD